MNFREYWNENKELFKQLNVTEASARKIWSDCLDNFEKALTNKYLKSDR